MIPQRIFVILMAAAALSLGLALLNGSLPLSPLEVWNALLGSGDDTAAEVIWQLRLPRVLAAFACGGLLALSGVLLQALLRNPLADPYILGISGGAAVGALAAMLLGARLVVTQISSFGGAVLAILAVFGLGFRRGERNIYRLLLTGVVLSAGCGAVVSILLTLAQGEQVKGMLFWLMGDLSRVVSAYVVLTALLVVAAAGILLGHLLDILALGETKAMTLGLNTKPLQVVIFVVAAVATTAVVVSAGPIGFVGLLVPHAVRMLGVTRHRALIVFSIFAGGAFLVWADLLARSVAAPLQLPVGAVTAMLGVPLLLLLLIRR